MNFGELIVIFLASFLAGMCIALAVAICLLHALHSEAMKEE